MSWWHHRFRHLEHSFHHAVREIEHIGKRGLFYIANEAPYVIAGSAFIASYFGTPLAGALVAGIGGEAERWGEYYALRENPHHGEKYSTWEARQRARKFAKRTWEYGAAGAGAGSLASIIAGGFSATVEVGTSATSSVDSAEASAAAEAKYASDTAVAYQMSLGPNLPDIGPGQFIVQNSAGEFSVQGPVTPGFFSRVLSLPGQAWDWISANPWTAGGALIGTGATVAGSLGVFGRTGSRAVQDIQTGLGLANDLAALGGGSPGGPPVGGDVGGGEAPASFSDQLRQLLETLAPFLIFGSVFFLLLVLFMGA